MVQQDVPLGDRGEQIVCTDDCLLLAGSKRRLPQVFPVSQLVHGHQAVHVHGPVNGIEVAPVEPEHLEQVFHVFCRAVVGDLQAHGLPVAR